MTAYVEIDINGNRRLRLRTAEGSFAYQTLGATPDVHSYVMRRRGKVEITTEHLGEIAGYIMRHGTDRQKRILKQAVNMSDVEGKS